MEDEKKSSDIMFYIFIGLIAIGFLLVIGYFIYSLIN